MNRGKTERLLNLVFALMATVRPLTRDDIRESVAGYDSDVSSESFERMFERDKDELRSMGVPVLTVMNAFDEVLGYRISQDSYRLIDLNLTARELEILSVTQDVWDQTVLGPAARSAVWKVGALGMEVKNSESLPPLADSLMGLARIRAREAAILPLLKAARERRIVEFGYKPLGKEVEKRIFEPWSVVCRSGRWYTVGFDVVRSAQRTFKLSRIQGSVVVTARKATGVVDKVSLSSLDFPKEDDQIEATIVIAQSHGAALRKNASSIKHEEFFDTVSITASQSDLVEWILRSLPEIQRIDPLALRESVMSTLVTMESRFSG